MDHLPVNKAALAGVIFAAALLFIVWWPLAVIWSVNTLFRTEIPMNLSTWLAVVVLVSIFRIATLKKNE
jgi:hypothetical protein